MIKVFKNREELIEGIKKYLGLTSKDIMYNTEGNTTIIVGKTCEITKKFFDCLDCKTCAAMLVDDKTFNGGFIRLKSGKVARFE